ncbi:uncharacterized protein LOC129586073 [Paramacrobiotus metropolitanus]|uniref:uncharacterized protein LOC129586073 n=1 Tax=Paramacrobiotus metropolitanus TaxID=2943436 RepID=UPI002445FA52|nr:uncharacterized protein LOC129586073 [Paramacrobiotus metropolitanus]
MSENEQAPMPKKRASLLQPSSRRSRSVPSLQSAQSLKGACREACQRNRDCVVRQVALVGILAGIVLLVLGIVVFDGEMIYIILGGCFLGLSYFFYMVSTFCNNSYLKFLKEAPEMHNIFDHIKEVQDAQPQIRFEMECYHKELRTRHVRRRDTYGNVRWVYETYNVSVTSWEGSRYLAYTGWSDASNKDQLVAARSFEQAFVDFYKTYQLVGPNAHQSFQVQKMQFIMENQGRDQAYNFREILEIPGYVDQALAVFGESKPCCMNCGCYSLASIFLCEFCCRVCLMRRAPRDTYTYTKLIEL